jgi:hypothetical protein
MTVKKTDRFLKAKHHEDDLIQVNPANKSITLSQASQSGTPIRSFLTFEAIEELYEEVQKHK